jgi:hypothetical protein
MNQPRSVAPEPDAIETVSTGRSAGAAPTIARAGAERSSPTGHADKIATNDGATMTRSEGLGNRCVETIDGLSDREEA